jgi:hypothetical protein
MITSPNATTNAMLPVIRKIAAKIVHTINVINKVVNRIMVVSSFVILFIIQLANIANIEQREKDST